MSRNDAGLKIRTARERLRWSVAELARAANIKQRTLEDIESGATSSVDVYNCGAWNTALRCFYFHHAPDVADATRREEIICKQKVIFGGGSFWSKPKD